MKKQLVYCCRKAKRWICFALTHKMVFQLLYLTITFGLIFIALWFLLPVKDGNALFYQMTSYDESKGSKLAYLVGVAFFSGFLVMILTNGVRNTIEKAQNGDVIFGFDNHVLIFGYNESIIGLISKYNSTNQGKKKKSPIVIVAKNNIREIREQLGGMFGTKDKIYVMHSSQINQDAILTFYPDRAKQIYIVGNNEENVDFLNLKLYHTLSTCSNYHRWNTPICLYLHEPSSITLLKNRHYDNDLTTPYGNKISDKNLSIINTDELWARKVVVDANFEWRGREIIMRNDRNNDTLTGNMFSHIVIFGMNTTSEILATTIARTCHHPNSIIENIKNRITIIDNDFSKKMGAFFGKYNDLMELCHYQITRFEFGDKLDNSYNHHPSKDNDFIDIEWNFIETNNNDRKTHKMLVNYLQEKTNLSVFVCEQDSTKGVNISLNLPKLYYEKNIPVWVYSHNSFNINEYMKGSRYDNIRIWGMSEDISLEKECIEETFAKYLNYYMKNDFDSNANTINIINNTWMRKSIDERYRDIDTASCAISIIKCLKLGNNGKKKMNEDELHLFMSKVEHIRWCISQLLDGYRPLTKQQKEMLSGITNKKDIDKTRMELKKEFYHPYIKPFESLTNEEKELNYNYALMYERVYDFMIEQGLIPYI